MKKILSVLLIIILMFSFVISASADDTKFNVKITSSASKVKPGDEFEVTFLVTDITEKDGLISFEPVIEYDASKIVVINKTNVYPSQWGKYAADFSPAYGTDSNGKQVGSWSLFLLYDGDETGKEISVFKDNELGVKITFKALESASGKATVGLNSELLATANSEPLNAVSGKSSPITIEISSGEATQTTQKVVPTTTGTTKAPTVAPTVAPTAPSTTAAEKKTTASAQKTQTSAASATEAPIGSASVTDETSGAVTSSDTTGSTAGTSAVTTEATSSASESESATDSTAASQTGSAATTSKTPETTAAVKKDDGNFMLVIIAVIAAIVLAAVAFFAIKKFKKNTDDDNPVNPG